MSKWLKLLIALIIFLVIVVAIVFYWQHQKYYPSTDDAYIQANIINVAPQVSGQIDQIKVQNNQSVKKGDLLFSIDSKPFIYKLDQATAQLKQAQQDIVSKMDAIKTAQANADQRQAQEIVAKQNYDRVMYLIKEHQISQSDADQATSTLRAARAALAAAQADVLKAQDELGETNSNNANIKIAEANLKIARLNLQYAQIYAPADGIIVNFALRQGDIVNTNETLFSIVENNSWWVDANYKETDLTRIRIGQKAKIYVDIYPNYLFTGHVESISAGSGSVFSILPPENASGNWIKVTQRFPVKILIDKLNPTDPLRVGASSTVIIDTTS